ncbi:dihydrolipoamide acyltransferase [bacterium]|nr:dihydrolipoamide acyltransferase [bacterium]
MASIIEMPKLSDTMTSGKIISWVVKEGDTVEAGSPIAEVETDKATMELEIFEDGTVLKLLAEPDSAVPIGTPVAIIGEAGEDVSNLVKEAQTQSGGQAEPAKEEPKEEKKEAPAPQPSVASSPATPEPKKEAPKPQSGKVRISPVAQRMALENNIDINTIQGSGPDGRIVKRDIEKAMAEGAPAAATQVPPATAEETTQAALPPSVIPSTQGEQPYVDVPLNRIRQITAERLPQSLGPVPHFYLETEIDPEPLMDMKRKLQDLSPETRITLTDILIKGVASALQRHPEINSQFIGNAVRRFYIANIGLAVAGDDALTVPVIKFCNAKSIGQIARERADLVDKAQQGKLHPDDLSGATFTISNLGMMGITKFCAVINPPQSAILAIGSLRDEPVVKDGQVVPGKRMNMTLSCDHRAFDGAEGAAFMASLKDILEKPLTLYL